MKSDEQKSNNLRIKEIAAELAEMKRSFFVDGIEHPMARRVSLEAESANLCLKVLKEKTKEKALQAQVRQLRGEILRKRLIELGYPSLIDECNKLAEQQISDEVTA